jgi:hypothetical protein
MQSLSSRLGLGFPPRILYHWARILSPEGGNEKIRRRYDLRNSHRPLAGYLIQVPLPSKKPMTEYVPITITLMDRATGEKGEGCLFLRLARLR